MARYSGEIAALANEAQQKGKALRRKIARLDGKSRAARSLFLNEDGAINDQAALLIADLARESGMFRHDFHPDVHELYFLKGGQHIVKYLIDLLSLEPEEFEDLKTQLERNGA